MSDSHATHGRGLRADSFALSVFVLLASTVLQRAVGFGRGVLFCRWLAPETLGEWEMAFSFLLTAAPLAVLGVPGSFGRYAEHYRQRGHLRTFLTRTAIWTVMTGLFAVAMVAVCAPTLAQLAFGDRSFAPLMAWSGACLAAVILCHTLTSLLAGLRQYRAVSAVNFIQSVSFAVVSLELIWRRPTAEAVVISYGVSCIAASIAGAVWMWPALRETDLPDTRLPHGQFWNKLLRFAFFIWLTNCLANLFAIIDRYMLVHCANMTAAEALAQVGNYHSSRVIPLLLVSVAELLSGMIMPYLSHDWETGRRREVSHRLNLTLKLTTIGMLIVGVGVLVAGPFLFHVVLKGKYDGGLAVLPWTLAGCLWFGVYSIAQNYLWCAEKTKLSVVPLILGLAVNVGLNFVLLPTMGLMGAVLSTAIATAVTLGLVLALSQRHGMKVDVGTWLLAATPAALGFGLWPGAAATAVVIAAGLATNLVLSANERRELVELALQSLGNIQTKLGWRRPAVAS